MIDFKIKKINVKNVATKVSSYGPNSILKKELKIWRSDGIFAKVDMCNVYFYVSSV